VSGIGGGSAEEEMQNGVVQADKMNGDIDKLREKCKCLAALVKKVKQSRYRPVHAQRVPGS